MTGWSRSRRQVAAAAFAVGLLTAAAGAAAGGAVWHAYYAVLYVALTAGAAFSPPALTLQVPAGLVLAASVLLQPGGPSPLLLAPLVAGIVLTAELLGFAARLDAPAPRQAARDVGRAGTSVVDVGRAGTSVLIGACVYAAVAVLAEALPGPGGLLAVALGAAACVLLAVALVQEAA